MRGRQRQSKPCNGSGKKVRRERRERTSHFLPPSSLGELREAPRGLGFDRETESGVVEAFVPPMEDAVQALIDHLVYPLLPAKDFFTPHVPDIAQQESVAKQIHGVVILYNYYHRKQYAQLDFLDTKSFCKVASVAKPSLLRYMKFIHSPENVPNKIDQLSITEKMVWDACNICTGLNEARDISAMENWPVSKVAVLLVDSTKTNCFLQFSSITQGVWSLIEKDVDKSFGTQLNISVIDTTSKKRKNAHGHLQDKIEDAFQSLAFSAVKEKTGITEEELTILEHDIVYSLSQQKATAQFYLMQYTGASSDKITEFPLKDVVDRLKYEDGLSFSLGQQRILGENVQAGTTTVEEFEINDRLAGGAEEVLGKKVSKENSEIINGKQGNSDCMIRRLGVASRPHNGCKDFPLKHQEKTQIKDETESVENFIENMHVDKGKRISVNSVSLMHGGVSKEKVHLDGFIKKPCNLKPKYPRPSFGRDACNAVLSGQGGGAVTDHLPLVSMPCYSKGFEEIQPIPMDKFQAVMESKKKDLLEASLRVLRRKQEDLHQQQRLLEDEIARCEMNLQTILSEEEDNLMLKFDSIIEACNTLCSNQVHLGYVNQSQSQKAKRRKLCEAVLSLQTPCQASCYFHHGLILKELDGICSENHWMLPRYNILPSLNHGYRASVTIQGPDFECKGDGDLCGNPQGARESAATHVLSKLRSMASQVR
ncbi:hypothetical protein Taro_007206 [Colocasia esculenta]|uniref:DRBM domain-containing protein n=1 Tax=Colocasia esculenta TaxID=4460 RepID=A0A843TXK1_COLES|nr:hypothetical protein [Colocasia esculenta]